nr:Chain C, Sendai virus nucleoprotein [Respirovirus muris]4PGB_F Chain F, Sendai virus nucleoprotein [Respirovirus muris]
FAPGNWPAL